VRRAAEKKASEHQNEKGAGLHRGSGKLRAAAPANPAPLQDSESADDGNGNDFYFCVADENGEKVAAVFGDDDTDGGGGAASGKPVAPADDESSVITEGAARKIVLAAAAGNRCAKLRHGRCAGKCVESAENPNAEKHPDVGKKFGDVARRSNDASGDGVSDGRGHTKPHAKNLEQTATASRARSVSY